MKVKAMRRGRADITSMTLFIKLQSVFQKFISISFKIMTIVTTMTMTRRISSLLLLLLTLSGNILHSVDAQNNCMLDVHGGSASCTAQDFEFRGVTGFVVYDGLAQPPCNCNCWGAADCATVPALPDGPVDCTGFASPLDCGEFEIGTVFGACLGNDDNVDISLTVEFYAKNAVEDIGLYISTGSNDALNGQCTIAALTPGTYGTVTVSETSTPANSCPDITGSGVLTNYPLNNLVFPCVDVNPVDNYLDFDIALVFGGTSGCDPSGPNYPKPNTNAKCWYEPAMNQPNGARIKLKIHVPSFPTPSAAPSVSSMPSSQPSQEPSEQPSSVPSSSPSDKPSQEPSNVPSVAPSTSSAPSDQPSISSQPSSKPSSVPTSQPSSMPSDQPSSEPSSMPSDQPSNVPSFSPSDVPSTSPSDRPSSVPSSSPSDIPSLSPTVSAAPSISSAPSSDTEEPSQSPSESQMPSSKPSMEPSVSSKPTISPSVAPSAAPSSSPTGFPWYPDWTYEAQVCKNDALAPKYMKELQRMNYIYTDREECCRNHFSWRMMQCMGNERLMYYSDGTKCDSKMNFEHTELNSMQWIETTLFETAEECCRERFWWDISGCLADSPKEIQFVFSITMNGVAEPTNCQDADRMARVLQDAANVGWDDENIHAFVTSIGDVELSTNDDGLLECGGSLEGTGYAGTYDPKDKYVLDSSNVITLEFKVSAKSKTCSDDACFTALYTTLKTNFSLFAGYGLFTTEILLKAGEQGVVALSIADADATSITYGSMITTAMITAALSSGLWYPNWENTDATAEVHKHTCTNDGREPSYMKENANDYLFDSQAACCKTWFVWEDDCVTGEIVPTDLYYYPSWTDMTCSRKQENEFEYWETDKYTTLDECCSSRFAWMLADCCDTPGMGGCTATADPVVTTVYFPDWTDQQCVARDKALLEPWEVQYAESTTDKCCDRHFSWAKKICCRDSGGC